MRYGSWWKPSIWVQERKKHDRIVFITHIYYFVPVYSAVGTPLYGRLSPAFPKNMGESASGSYLRICCAEPFDGISSAAMWVSEDIEVHQ